MKQVIGVLIVVAVLSGVSYAANGTVSGRIIGGSNVIINDYPFMVRMYRDLNSYCGAVVIGPYHALTAAHCVYGIDSNAVYGQIHFRGGSTNQYSGGNVFSAWKLTMHPLYNHTSLEYDIAVVEITTSFYRNPIIKPIPMQEFEPAASTSCYALGWGNTSPSGPQSPTLQIGYYTLGSQQYCYSMHPIAFATPSKYCATSQGGRICFGDSGGALVCGGRLHGINSFLSGWCDANKVEGFAKVPFSGIRSFIRQVSGI
ncbi:trypsin alpha-like [Anopheles albimanus]|uniref:Uncharacterized protein n=1 Tax=Anopheles albimanus TaxID=7167 RepID=A0A182FUP7_ANOAL|nr:trypsin alpha-like [Anopheles albimanus]